MMRKLILYHYCCLYFERKIHTKYKKKYHWFALIFPPTSMKKIGVTFPSHRKKLDSILRFWLQKWDFRFFTLFTHEETPKNNISLQSVENKHTLIVFVGTKIAANFYQVFFFFFLVKIEISLKCILLNFRFLSD